MNHPFCRLGLCGVLALGLIGAGRASAEAPSCAEVARKIQREVTAKPERVLIIVEDALVVDDSCACEVIKAAIVAAKAKPKLVGQIVFTAVTASPKTAALIAECAAAASPDAAVEIKAALTKALGRVPAAPAATTPAPPPTPTGAHPAGATDHPAVEGKNPAPDKNPPQEPIAPPPLADFGASPVSISGVYLVYPSGGAAPTTANQTSIQTLRRVLRTPRVIIIHPPTATSSAAFPGG